MTRTRTLAILLALTLSTAASADADSEVSLKTIMQNLQSDTSLIVEGLLNEDFDTVEAAAVRIADHPRIPPSQVALVAAELGPEMPSFKRFDTRVHDLALSIRAGARKADSNAIAADYTAMLESCLACHRAFKERVSAALGAN